MRRLEAELALQNIRAIQEFDQISRKLTRWLIVLTCVLVVLTAVITRFTIVLAQLPSK